jgi:taurine--2-oxoglutarate transaminase
MTDVTVAAMSNADVKSADREHVFHSWSAQGSLDPLVLEGGLGCEVWDAEGNRWLDFSSMLVNVNIGHQHPKLISAIQDQAARFATVAPAHATSIRSDAARRILAHAPEGFSKIFFTNGGADANENAMRMARQFTGRDKIVSHYRSYHGNTGAAVVATGDWRRMPNEFSRGHVHVFGPYLYRSEFEATTPEEECARALRHLERVVQGEGPASIAGILLETIPGTAGILMPPPGYLTGVREIADRYGIVLILDEVMAGFARTGEWLAFDAEGVVPDLVTFAKGVNSGYVPVGGVMISDPIARHFDDRVFPGGLTYSGHPLASASIVAAIDAMESEGVIENARTIGAEQIGPALRALQDKHGVIGEIRGRGVFWAVEFVADRDTREPVSAPDMGRLKKDLLARGLLPFIQDNRIHIVPPAVVTADEVTRGIGIIDAALGAW